MPRCGLLARDAIERIEDGSTDYYFTPRAAQIAGPLATRYSAKPCSTPPLIEGMSLLAGDQRSRDLLSKKK